jgi:hypothetical protein
LFLISNDLDQIRRVIMLAYRRKSIVAMGFLLLLSLLSSSASAQTLLQQCAGSTVFQFTPGLINIAEPESVNENAIMTGCVALSSFQPVKQQWSGPAGASCLDTNIVPTLGTPGTITWSDNTISNTKLLSVVPIGLGVVGTVLSTHQIIDGHDAGHKFIAEAPVLPPTNSLLCILGAAPIQYVTGAATFTIE